MTVRCNHLMARDRGAAGRALALGDAEALSDTVGAKAVQTVANDHSLRWCKHSLSWSWCAAFYTSRQLHRGWPSPTAYGCPAQHATIRPVRPRPPSEHPAQRSAAQRTQATPQRSASTRCLHPRRADARARTRHAALTDLADDVHADGARNVTVDTLFRQPHRGVWHGFAHRANHVEERAPRRHLHLGVVAHGLLLLLHHQRLDVHLEACALRVPPAPASLTRLALRAHLAWFRVAGSAWAGRLACKRMDSHEPGAHESDAAIAAAPGARSGPAGPPRCPLVAALHVILSAGLPLSWARTEHDESRPRT